MRILHVSPVWAVQTSDAPGGAPMRPTNGWALFRALKHSALPKGNIPLADWTQQAAQAWRDLPAAERAQFTATALAQKNALGEVSGNEGNEKGGDSDDKRTVATEQMHRMWDCLINSTHSKLTSILVSLEEPQTW